MLLLSLLLPPLVGGLVCEAPSRAVAWRHASTRPTLLLMAAPPRKRKRDILVNLFRKNKMPRDQEESQAQAAELAVAASSEDSVVLAPPPEAVQPSGQSADQAASSISSEVDNMQQEAPPMSVGQPPAGSDSAEKEMIVQRPIMDVFDVVTDFDKYPLWVTGLKKVARTCSDFSLATDRAIIQLNPLHSLHESRSMLPRSLCSKGLSPDEAKSSSSMRAR